MIAFKYLFSLITKPNLYLDPGSGSLLIQLILGTVLGLGVLVRVYWKNIKSFISRGKASAEEVNDPTAIVEDSTAVVTKIQTQESNDKEI
jgi:hypothetical protein